MKFQHPRRAASLLAVTLTTLCASATLWSQPAPAADSDPDSVANLITSLRLQEGTTPARERKGWRKPKKIVVLGAASPAQREAFAAAAPGAKIVVVKDMDAAAVAATDADVVVGITSYKNICEPEVIDSARQLRWILSMSAGVERCIAIASVESRDLLVTNLRGVDSAAIAEHAVSLALALARGLDTFVTDKNAGRWNRDSAGATKMQVLNGKTALVVGLGGIGTEVAMRAHALGMKVIATRNSGRTGPDYVSYVGPPSELLTLAKTADVIVNCVPLTTETTGIFNAAFFAVLKPNAFFINVARGKSVVTADLVSALNEHRIAGAGLDVVEPEPLPPDHPLWKSPNLILTPHISSASDLPPRQRWIIATENLRRYVAGEKMLSVVDLKREY
ncbi:MAG: D-2-hydroxyacid dehydrogenase [Gammaproteobacteria bacterium]